MTSVNGNDSDEEVIVVIIVVGAAKGPPAKFTPAMNVHYSHFIVT